PEGLIAPVVELRQIRRTARGEAEVVLLVQDRTAVRIERRIDAAPVRHLLAADRTATGVVEAGGVQRRGAQELVGVAVQVVGPGLVGNVCECACGGSIFGGEVLGLV